jgi:hypothetical protein
MSNGHFTQVVWKGSDEIGFGIAKTNTGKTFIVANYNPAGNTVGFCFKFKLE